MGDLETRVYAVPGVRIPDHEEFSSERLLLQMLDEIKAEVGDSLSFSGGHTHPHRASIWWRGNGQHMEALDRVAAERGWEECDLQYGVPLRILDKIRSNIA